MKVLVVDDDGMLRAFYNAVLSAQYEIFPAASGEEALDTFSMIQPELILMDIEMPGIDGYETCRRMREFTDVPIIFATALTTMEEHLRAYEAGGDDLMIKPLVPDIVQRKVAMAITKRHEQSRLQQEKDSVQKMAMNFLSTMGENGILLNFVRDSLSCHSFDELSDKLVNALQDFGLQGSFLIRYDKLDIFRTTHGEITGLERSILDKSSSMGRIFQFRQNMVVNYDQISIVVSGLPPEEEDKIGRVRDNLAILAETAEAFCENVDMRKASMKRAENMQVALYEASKAIAEVKKRQQQMLMDVRILLNEMTSKIEDSYSWLGTSKVQEDAISESMSDSVQKIIEVLATGSQTNVQLEGIIRILKGGNEEDKIDFF